MYATTLLFPSNTITSPVLPNLNEDIYSCKKSHFMSIITIPTTLSFAELYTGDATVIQSLPSELDI